MQPAVVDDPEEPAGHVTGRHPGRNWRCCHHSNWRQWSLCGEYDLDCGTFYSCVLLHNESHEYDSIDRMFVLDVGAVHVIGQKERSL